MSVDVTQEAAMGIAFRVALFSPFDKTQVKSLRQRKSALSENSINRLAGK
jgi:hypothetical protein